MSMKTITINTLTSLTLTMILLLAFNCGSGENTLEIRDGFYIDTYKAETPQQVVDYEAIDIIGNAIDKFESIYGKSQKKINIELQDYSFYSEELGKYVSGLNYNYGDSCKLVVGIHPSSDCQTAMVLWHELYHCVMDESDHGQWAYDLFDLKDKYKEEGGCRE